VMRYTLY